MPIGCPKTAIPGVHADLSGASGAARGHGDLLEPLHGALHGRYSRDARSERLHPGHSQRAEQGARAEARGQGAGEHPQEVQEHRPELLRQEEVSHSEPARHRAPSRRRIRRRDARALEPATPEASLDATLKFTPERRISGNDN